MKIYQVNLSQLIFYSLDPKSVAQITRVYEDLNFPQRYIEYEETTFNTIKSKILKNTDSFDSLRNILMDQLNRTFNRT